MHLKPIARQVACILGLLAGGLACGKKPQTAAPELRTTMQEIVQSKAYAVRTPLFITLRGVYLHTEYIDEIFCDTAAGAACEEADFDVPTSTGSLAKLTLRVQDAMLIAKRIREWADTVKWLAEKGPPPPLLEGMDVFFDHRITPLTRELVLKAVRENWHLPYVVKPDRRIDAPAPTRKPHP